MAKQFDYNDGVNSTTEQKQGLLVPLEQESGLFVGVTTSVLLLWYRHQRFCVFCEMLQTEKNQSQ